MRFDVAGIQLDVEPATVSMSPEEGITIVYLQSEVSNTKEGISANSGAAITVESRADFSLSAGGAVEIEAGGDVSVSDELVNSRRSRAGGPPE